MVRLIFIHTSVMAMDCSNHWMVVERCTNIRYNRKNRRRCNIESTYSRYFAHYNWNTYRRSMDKPCSEERSKLYNRIMLDFFLSR